MVLAFFKPAQELQSLVGAPVPIKQLFDYQRVTLDVGQSITLRFTVTPATLALADAEGNESFFPGRYTVEFSRGHGAVLEHDVMGAVAEPLRINTMAFNIGQ